MDMERDISCGTKLGFTPMVLFYHVCLNGVGPGEKEAYGDAGLGKRGSWESLKKTINILLFPEATRLLHPTYLLMIGYVYNTRSHSFENFIRFGKARGNRNYK